MPFFRLGIAQPADPEAAEVAGPAAGPAAEAAETEAEEAEEDMMLSERILEAIWRFWGKWW